jgi:hypothetical protein
VLEQKVCKCFGFIFFDLVFIILMPCEHVGVLNLFISNLPFIFILQVKILKAEATSPTIVEGKLEVEGLVNKTLSKLGSLRIEQSALWKQLEIKRSMLEEKME